MIAYKGTENLKCFNKKYEVNETYEIEGELKMCKNGFHFCENLIDIHGFYPFFNKDTVILEIEVLGDIIKDGIKSVTNKMKVLRIIPKTEYCKISPKHFDKNGNLIYWENLYGNWWKRKYDKNNNEIYWEDSTGFWWKSKYNKNNNMIYYKYSDGYFERYKYDKDNNIVNYRDPCGNEHKYSIL